MLQALLLCLALISRAAAFMPNQVFSFRPPGVHSSNVLPDVDIDAGYKVDDFYPVEAEDGPLDDGSWTHKDIVKRACLNTFARYFEETLPGIAPGSLQTLPRLTPTNLLRAVFGPTASTSKFERAIEQIEIAAAKMDLWYEKNATINEAANVARAHFDDEQFQLGHDYLLQLRRQMFAALQQGATTAARDLAGRYMLTLQDFYAHSNYVEMGRMEPLKELGKPGMKDFLNKVAGKATTTCSDCVSSDAAGDCSRNSCINNANPSVQNSRLTSGYFIYPTDGNRQKPIGKCSHGDPTDRSRVSSASGGINKSTRNCRKSPHYFLHENASQLAIKATEIFLTGIRDVIGDDQFLQFFDLGVQIGGSSLCFVVDQSGSMKDDINAVRARVKQIVQSSNKPYNYVLVQFNDDDKTPAYGPPIVTQDAQFFISQVEALNADGGGDCPELAMHGLQLALINCLSGSPIYLFTDAGPKDYYLEQAVYSLIDSTRSQVNVFFTGSPPPCGNAPNLFNNIVARSGGQFLDVTKSTVSAATALTQATAEATQGTVLSVIKALNKGNYMFTVDCTVSALTVSVGGNNPVVQVFQPDGSAVPHSVLLTNFILFNVTSPIFGQWRVICSFSSSPHSIVVKASSNIGFSHNFVFVGGRPGHLGVFPITGQPVIGKLTKLVLTVDGLEDVSSVGNVVLIDSNGTDIDSYVAEQGNGYSTNLFGLAFFPPQKPFRIQVQGTDRCGYNFSRVSVTEIKSQTIEFITGNNNVDNVVEPGSFTNATFILHNSGETDTFTVVYSDDQGFGEDLTVVLINDGDAGGVSRTGRAADRLLASIVLEQNQSALVTATVHAPDEATIGQATTATITATNQKGSTFNYVVLQIVVTPEEQDELPPVCQITDYSLCTGVTALHCGEYTRNVTARIQDTGVGLQSVRSGQRAVMLDYTKFDSGTNQTVQVIASASCCYLNIDIQSSDVVGNLQTCSSIIPPGVLNEAITLRALLIPVKGSTAAGVASVTVRNWDTLSFSVNVTHVTPTTFQLARGLEDDDVLFTEMGFNYGNVLSGSRPADGSHLPIIYGRKGLVRVQSRTNSVAELTGHLVSPPLRQFPDYEALLSCERVSPCEAAGYIALSLGSSDPLNAQYYLAVGGAATNCSAMILGVNESAINLTTDDGTVGFGKLNLTNELAKKLQSSGLDVIVRSPDGVTLRGTLSPPWQPTAIPTSPPPTSLASTTTVSHRPSAGVLLIPTALAYILTVAAVMYLRG